MVLLVNRLLLDINCVAMDFMLKRGYAKSRAKDLILGRVRLTSNFTPCFDEMRQFLVRSGCLPL